MQQKENLLIIFIMRAALGCLLWLMLLSPVWAGDETAVREKLKRTTQEINQTQKTLQKLESKEKTIEDTIARNKAELVSAAEKEQSVQRKIEEIENDLSDLQDQKSRQLEHLQSRHGHMNQTLTRLITLSTHSPAALMALPVDQNNVIRALGVSRTRLRQTEHSVNEVRKQLAALQATESKIQLQHARLENQLEELEKNKGWLEYLMAKRSQNYREIKTERERGLEKIAKLSAESENIQGLLARLAEERRLSNLKPAQKPSYLKASKGKAFTSARGKLSLPVSGAILTRFGEKTETGSPSRGMYIAAKPGAVVTAPYEGEVVYAAPFRDYGNLVILDHGDGYHTLLSGMNALDTKVGEWLLSGEPVGTMGTPSAGRLYVEFRKGGKPINMSPWIAGNQNNISG